MGQFDEPYHAVAKWYDQWLIQGTLFIEVLPALWQLIGNVQGQSVLDLACGQGIIARELAQCGAHVVGVDRLGQLLRLTREYELREPRGMHYLRDDAQGLRSLADASFEGVVCSTALMDIPDMQATFDAVRRVLRPSGWFAFAITHPCFETPLACWVHSEDGTVARAIRGYFREGYWRSNDPAGLRGRVGARHRTLSTYLNALADAGFQLERVLEPQATPNRRNEVPGNREVPTLLLVRARAVRTEATTCPYLCTSSYGT